MTREDLLKAARGYSADQQKQKAYIAGAQYVMNLIAQLSEQEYEPEFMDEVIVLGALGVADFDKYFDY